MAIKYTKIKRRTPMRRIKVSASAIKKKSYSYWTPLYIPEFEDKKLEKIYNDLVELGDKLGEIKERLFDDFTKLKDGKKKSKKIVKRIPTKRWRF